MSADADDGLKEKQRAWGREGGKMSLLTMTPWERKVRAHEAGIQGGRPIRIDHDKVRELRAQGLKHREIAAELGISLASVARIVRGK
jgi:hypothetical protein